VVGLYFFLSRSLPDYSEDFRLPAFRPRSRSCATTPTCRISSGETDEDVYFALGFAHAQDRLWQMTMLRRTAQGRLSEIFGQRTVRIDELMRRSTCTAWRCNRSRCRTSRRARAGGLCGAASTPGSAGERGARGGVRPEFFLFQPEIAPGPRPIPSRS
jgi:penicillin G amidase